MRTFSRYTVLAGLLTGIIFCISACSEDIPVVRPGPPIPVVYGVFDLSKPAHYIKLSKTFAGEADPYTLAGDHDRIFYNHAEVFLTEGSGSYRIPFTLETGIPRLAGDFPETPNESYVLHQQLFPGNYTLTVILPDEKDTLTADFAFINTFKVITPKAGFKRFYFYEDPILFSWQADPSAGLFEITFQLKYEEWLKSGLSRACSINFTRQIDPAELEIEKDRRNYRFYSDSFFAHLGTGIIQNPEVDFRKPLALQMLITAADTTIAKYLKWFHLEIDDQVNPNGNVKGAIGVVGTKFSVPFNGLILSGRSQDSLVRGRYTRKLDFVNNPDW